MVVDLDVLVDIEVVLIDEEVEVTAWQSVSGPIVRRLGVAVVGTPRAARHAAASDVDGNLLERARRAA
ncbi:MAG: hypothetical protein LC792_18275 [Actinobacteria bacterium]|nr:hypothetical protein [Actinomycetota bacterium]